MPEHTAEFQRFVMAQDAVYVNVIFELTDGRKTTHWMWFVFPQLGGLGHSHMAIKYGLQSADEARAYWEHPVLGPRLRECIELVLAVDVKSAHDIFGSPDDLKFRSCLTLFDAAVVGETLFGRALQRFYAGKRDPRTVELLGAV